MKRSNNNIDQVRLWNAATGVCLAKLEGHKGKVGSFISQGRKVLLPSKITFFFTLLGVVCQPCEREGGQRGQVHCLFLLWTFTFFQTETRHGEVRVWPLPEKAQILMEGRPEERREKDPTDPEDKLKHQENESKELMGNLIEMNNSTDSKALWQKSNKQENGSEQETDIEVSQETDVEMSQETDIEVSQETDVELAQETTIERSQETEVEVSREGRPLHHHPISTSVSGWFTLTDIILC